MFKNHDEMWLEASLTRVLRNAVTGLFRGHSLQSPKIGTTQGAWVLVQKGERALGPRPAHGRPLCSPRTVPDCACILFWPEVWPQRFSPGLWQSRHFIRGPWKHRALPPLPLPLPVPELLPPQHNPTRVIGRIMIYISDPLAEMLPAAYIKLSFFHASGIFSCKGNAQNKADI